MPEEDYAWLPRASLLTFEELTRVTRIFASLGVQKVRLTGGDCAALGSNLLQLRVHQPGVAEPVAYGEHGHDDPKA